MASAYPTITDMKARLSAMSLTAYADSLLQADLDAAIAAWEQMTDFVPFLSGASGTYLYTPRNTALVDFDGGFVSVSAIKTNVNYANPTGTLAVAGRDYTLKPDNAPSKGKPYTYVKFTFPVLNASLLPNAEASVQVTGVRGYAATVPADVWRAILDSALASSLQNNAVLIAGGAQKVKQDTVEYDFGSSGGTTTQFAKSAQSRLELLARKYQRLKVV